MIEIIKDDITKLDVEAIVNAANSALRGGGGVDGAIHRAAGPQLLEACKQFDGCPTGEARITPGFLLPAKWVIHTVGPVWQGGEQGEAALLESAYECSFQLAMENQVTSIAFPAISTGVYGYPKSLATGIALSTMSRYTEVLSRIVACCFSEEDVELYQTMLESL